MQYKTYSRQIVYTLVLFGLLVLSGKSCIKRFQDKFWSRGSNPDSSAGQKHLSGHTPAKNKDSNTSSDPVQETLDVDAGAKCDKGQGGGSGCCIPSLPSSQSVEVDSVIILDDFSNGPQLIDPDTYSSFVLLYEKPINSGVKKALAPAMSKLAPQEMGHQKFVPRLDKPVSNVVEGLDVEKKGLNLENKESLDQLTNDSEKMGGMVDQKDNEGVGSEKETETSGRE